MQTQTKQEAAKSRYSNKILTVPNILSFVRLAMIPLICYCYLCLKNSLFTALLLAISGLTDVADGFIARQFNMISDLGKALDPVADKLTQFIMLLCLVSRFPHMLVAVVLLAVKEAVNGASNIYLTRRTGKVYGALWHGKLATALLYAVMFLHLVWYSIKPLVSDILIGVCIAVMVMSAVLYAVRNIKVLKKQQ